MPLLAFLLRRRFSTSGMPAYMISIIRCSGTEWSMGCSAAWASMPISKSRSTIARAPPVSRENRSQRRTSSSSTSRRWRCAYARRSLKAGRSKVLAEWSSWKCATTSRPVLAQ